MYLAPPRAYSDLTRGLHGNHGPILVDAVGVVVAAWSRIYCLGMGTGMKRMLGLVVDHQVTGLDLPLHDRPTCPRDVPAPPRLCQRSTEALGEN